MKSIILTGGGTAGHIMPNVALIPDLKKHFDKIYYIGTNGMEKDIISKIEGVEFIEIEAVKLVRKLTLKNLLIPFKLLKSINKCKKIVKKIKPDIIFTKGGYVSVPVAIAGKKLKVPVLSHESDYSFGLANKIILKYSKFMFTSFRDTCEQSNKCIFTGSPIRKEIFEGNAEKIKNKYKISKNKQNLLIFGGSLGSRKINDTVFESIEDLTKNYNIFHIVGKNNLNKALKLENYFQIEFAENIWDYLAAADLVVSRAGANSIFELCALRKPMLLIPLSKAQSRGDQIENANLFKQKGYAIVLLEENLNKDTFLAKIYETERKSQKLIENMKTNNARNANKLIIEKILEVTSKTLKK